MSQPPQPPSSSHEERELQISKEALQNAANKIAQVLQRPEQLAQIDQLRFHYLKNEVSLNTQLNTAVTTQLKEVKYQLDRLTECLNILEQIKTNYSNVYQLSKDCQNLIPHYDLIQEVNVTRNNLLETKRELNNVLTIPQKIKKIRKLLSDDINILKVHQKLRELEQMRDAILIQTRNYPDQQKQLTELFADIGQLSEDFDKRLWELIESHFQLALVGIEFCVVLENDIPVSFCKTIEEFTSLYIATDAPSGSCKGTSNYQSRKESSHGAVTSQRQRQGHFKA